MLSLTWNAPREAFDDSNQILLEGKSVDEVMKNPDIDRDLARLKQQLAKSFD